MESSRPSSRSDVIRQWLTLFAIVGTFIVNAWSNINPLYGLTIGDISQQFFSEVLITPANYAFAIWGVIYLGLIAFGIYQLLPSQRAHPRLRRIDYWLILACVVQAIWVFLFLSRWFLGSLIAMLGILISLILIYRQLNISGPVPRRERWFVNIPFSIYLGWISVATVVNVALVLYDAGWTGGGIAPEAWTVIMAVVAAGLGAWLAIERRDRPYPLVIAWALGAIAVRQSDMPLIAVSTAGLAIALVILVVVLAFALPNRRRTEAASETAPESHPPGSRG